MRGYLQKSVNLLGLLIVHWGLVCTLPADLNVIDVFFTQSVQPFLSRHCQYSENWLVSFSEAQNLNRHGELTSPGITVFFTKKKWVMACNAQRKTLGDRSDRWNGQEKKIQIEQGYTDKQQWHGLKLVLFILIYIQYMYVDLQPWNPKFIKLILHSQNPQTGFLPCFHLLTSSHQGTG